jgi:hypothetical protein
MVPQGVAFQVEQSFSSRHRRSADRTLEPGRFAALLARVRSASLDGALIVGADPADSPQLAARALELTSPRCRAALADGLERLSQAARRPSSKLRVRPRRGVAQTNESRLRELAGVLRGPAPLYARGLALLNRLLVDGTGPAYVGDADALASCLARARAALDGDAPAVQQTDRGYSRHDSS